MLSIFLLLLSARASDAAAGYYNSPVVVSVPENPRGQWHASSGVKCENTQGSLSLNLSSVGLQRIDSDFANGSNVTCLSLENNEIDSVSSSAFRLMPNLHYLNLARNKLDLNGLAQLEDHRQLRTLILDENPSTATLSFANRFVSLAELHLRGLGLGNVSSLSFAPRLAHLYLSSNYLGNSSLAFLADAPLTLDTLDLANNGIRGLNASSLRSVKVLLLDDNRITRVCGKCRDSSALVLEGARRLRRLSLANNALTGIEPNAFDEVDYLAELDLSGNRLDSIRKNTFERVALLRKLSLKGNLLTDVPDFYGSEALEHLSLADNQLEALKNESFAELNKLKSVDLSNNKIGSMEAGAFAKQNFLETLDLSNNRLTNFPHTWLINLTNLKTLRVNGNPLKSLNSLKLGVVRSYMLLQRIYLYNTSITEIYTGYLYNSAFKNIANVSLILFDDTEQSSRAVDSAAGTCKCDCDEINDIL